MDMWVSQEFFSFLFDARVILNVNVGRYVLHVGAKYLDLSGFVTGLLC